MNKFAITTVAVTLLASSAAFAVKDGNGDTVYPVMGKVTELTTKKITIKNPNVTREMVLDSKTAVPAGLKVGDRVAIQAKFTAMGISKLPTPAAAKTAAKPAAAATTTATTTR